MQERKFCNFCGNGELSLKYDFESYGILECKKCHLIFRNKILLRKEETKLYDKDYYLNLQREYFINCLTPNPKDKSRLKDFNRRINLLQGFIKKPKPKLLDIGAGTGAFAYIAEKNGWRTSSIEISQFAAKIAREKFKIKMYRGDVTDKKFKETGFDIITLWEAIANIEDTRRLIVRVRRLLRKNGAIAILTTVVDSWLYYIANIIYWLSAKKVSYFVKEGYPIHHSNHFTRRALKKALRLEGFKVTYLENVEIPYKYTKLPKIFQPFLVIFGSIAKLTGITIQVLIVAKKTSRN